MKHNDGLSKVLIAPDIVEKLTGRTSDFVWELWKIGEDDDGLFFEFSDQPRQAEIQPEAREFAIQLQELLTQLTLDDRPVRFIVTLNSAGELVAEETNRGLGKWP